jgi:hypothetical protein
MHASVAGPVADVHGLLRTGRDNGFIVLHRG